MPSSTSNSDPLTAARALVALLLLLLLYFAGLEIVARLGFSRISAIQHRIREDYYAAQSIPPATSADPPTLLVVGNSLLLDGVNRHLLEQELAPNYSATFLPIENTQFDDWYFGLRRLFATGASPSAVVVCLSVRQIMSRATDGEYFARHLMQASDILAVKEDSQLDNTTASGYFLANHSEWLGGRAEIRNWLLQKLIPHLAQLTLYFPAKNPPMPSSEEVVARSLPHLKRLNELCEANHARLIVLVPPTLEVHDASAAVRQAAAVDGIMVLIPSPPRQLPAEDYSDGYHLNAKGAMLFTRLLGTALLQMLNSR